VGKTRRPYWLGVRGEVDTIYSTQEHLNVRILMQPSVFIRPRQTREMKRAGRYAWKIGRGLNLWVVINFECPEGDELLPQRQFQAIRKKMRSWLEYRQGKLNLPRSPITDIRTWEHVGERYHVNWVVHVPDQMIDEFQEKLPKWIEKVMGELKDCHVQKVYHFNGLLKYILKGTLASHAHRFGIDPSPQGRVWGRRAVAARCLGRAARESAVTKEEVQPLSGSS